MFGSAPSGGFSFGANNNNQQQQQQQQPAAGGIFGQPQQQQQNNAFGGGGGFGASTSGGGLFGQQQQPAGGGLFGASQQNNNQQPAAGGAFSFGQPQQQQQQQQPAASPFGAKPAGTFGSTGGFGSTANAGTSGGFSFGANNQQQQQSNTFGQQANSNPFGAKPATGGLFGQSSTPATGGGSLFGQQQQNNNATGAGGMFGAANASTGQVTTGSSNPTWQATVVQEKDPQNNLVPMAYQSITVMPQYKGMSIEEIRLQDYEQGRKSGNGGAPANSFGGFGAQQQQQQQPGQQTTGGIFGGAQNNTTGGFGQQQQPSGGLFGQQQQNQSGGLFGQQQQQQPSGGLFGQQQNQPGQSGGLFGQQNNQQPASTGFSFGANNNNNQQQQQQPAASGGFSFGAATNNNNAQKPGGLFGAGNTPGGFGSNTQQQPASSGGFSFGQSNQQQQQQPGQTTGGFGGSTGFSFGGASAQKPATGGLFGTSQPATSQPAPAFGGFGGAASSAAGAGASKPAFSFGGTSTAASGGAFGSSQAPATGGLFGAGASSQPTMTSQPAASGGLFSGFGQNNQQQQQSQPQQGSTGFGGFGSTANNASSGTGGSLFGGAGAAKPGGLFGNTTSQPAGQTGTGFGSSTSGGFSFGGANNNQQQQQNQQQKPGGLFGSGGNLGSTGGSLFGAGGGGGSSLFGQSNAGAGSTGLGGGLFGNNNNNNNQQQQGSGATGGLFGQSTLGGGAGQTNNFGASTGGLFGGASTNQQPQSSLPPQGVGLTSDPYGTDALFRSMTGGGAANQPSLPFNVSTNSASGNAPSLSASLKSKPLPAPMMSPFRPNPKNASRIVRLRGGTPAPDSSPSAGSGGAFGRSGSPALNGANGLFRGMSDDVGSPAGDGSLPSQAFVPRQSVKRLVLNDHGANSSFGRSVRGGTEEPNTSASGFKDSIFGNARSGTVPPRVSAAASGRNVTFSPALEAGLGSSRRDLSVTASGVPDDSFGDSFNRSRSGLFTDTPSKANNVLQPNGRDLFGRSKTANASATAAASSEPELALADTPVGSYHLSPSLNALRRMGHAQLSRVDNFTVTRKGFGSVRYLVPVDLTGIQDLSIIPGGIVQLREKEIWVYPQKEDLESGLDGMKVGYERNPVSKARQGEALNQPAEVALERCWPLDKATRQPLKEASHPRVKQHIAKLQKKAETQFVDFEPEIGLWRFEVDHFSRYGLDEDSDEEEPQQAAPATRSAARKNARDGDDDAPPPRRQLRASSRKPDAPPSLTSASSDEDEYLEEDAELASQGSSEFMQESELGAPKGWEAKESTPRAARFRQPRHGSVRPRDLREGSVASAADDDDGHNTMHRSASAQPWAAQLGVEARRVQVMQASFFGSRAPGESEDKQARTPLGESDVKRKFVSGPKEANATTRETQKQGRSNFGQSLTASQGQVLEKTPAAVPELTDVAPIANKFTKIDLQKSITQGCEGVPLDAGLAFGRSFRVGWGPGGMIVHGGRIQGVLTANKQRQSPPNATSTLQIEIAQPFKKDEEKEEQRAKALRLLELQLAHSDLDKDEEEVEDVACPSASPQSTLRFRDFAGLYENVDKSHEALIWKLGVALFDEIDLWLPEYATSEAVQAISTIRRKAALSAWLRHAVSGTVETEARGHVAASRKAALTFSYLTGYLVEKACCSALDSGDLRLATLLAQVDGGDDETRADVADQLAIWRQEGVDAHITKDHRRIYELLSGNVTLSSGTVSRSVRDPIDRVEDLSIAQGLDWKRAFGLHLWYGGSHSASLTSAFERYETAVGGPGETAPPLPPYREKASIGSMRLKELLKTGSYDRDAIFQIIKLYSNATFDLESALSPFGFGPVGTDYRLAWHLYMLISRAMRRRDFSDRADLGVEAAETANALGVPVEGNSARADLLTSDYAHQLELQGQWTWSAFVLLHLELENSRFAAVKALLTRNVGNFDEVSFEFLTGKLKIPHSWIYEAEAIRARSVGDRFSEFQLLIKAGMYTEAHRVVVNRLAPEAIIRGDVDMILSLFSPFEDAFPNSLSDLPGWSRGGAIYTDYVACLQHLPTLIVASETNELDSTGLSRLERLSQRVTQLLHSLPTLFSDHTNDPDSDSNVGLMQKVVLSDMTTALHNLARTLAVHDLAPKVGDAWTSSTIPPEIEHVQNSANDYIELLLA
ncbi:unnamed protein product [Sympodiomycopsis kandeliae]